MKKLSEYLLPTNDIAYGIVVFIVILFVVWLCWLVRWFLWLRRQQAHMQRCTDVRILKEGLHARLGKGDAAGMSAGENVLQLSPAEDADTVFRRFCEAKSVKEKSIVTKHVRTIFNAGWEESRLETGELIKHTTNELFMVNAFLRSLLATFIIVGILGTLFGLADSLSNLSPHGMNQQNNMAQLQEGLNRLLFALKSAFAPSIWGVGFTILGVLFFNTYIRFAAAPARNMLERLSLTVWVPQLYPSVSQKMVETLQRSQHEMERSFKAAQKVARFAEKIEGEVSELDENLRSASGALESLSQTSEGLSTFADKFVEGVGQLTPFQQDIRALYGQMVKDSQAFQSNVASSTTKAEDILSQLQAVINGLKGYEADYVSERQLINTRIKEVLDDAGKTFADLGERNRELAVAIGDPLRTELVAKLGEVENTLKVQLKGIQDRFAKFDDPINRAAEKIEGSLTTVVKRTDALVDELKRQFQIQNKTYYEQLEQLNKFNKEIPGLLEKLNMAGKEHDERSLVLKDAMNSLTTGVGKLDQSIGALSQTVKLPEQDGEQIGPVQAGQILLQLFKDNEAQQRQLKTLLDEVYLVRRNMGDSRPYRPQADADRSGRFTQSAETSYRNVAAPQRPPAATSYRDVEAERPRAQGPAPQAPPTQVMPTQTSPAQSPLSQSTPSETTSSQTPPGQSRVAPQQPPIEKPSTPRPSMTPSPATPVRPSHNTEAQAPLRAYVDQTENKWDSGPDVMKVFKKLQFWRK